ncbi:MAG: hypothetical protein LC751_02935 [Actinobacteria bacterium]|nr:hypothetical protein [Actinomycetota bacterium]
MADLPPSPDTSDDTSVGADRGPNTSTPRWVKVFGIIALVLVLLFGAHMLFVGSSRGPGRHTPPGDAGGQIPPSSVTLSSVTESGGLMPLAGGHTP